jgi:hypothetical protein
MAGNSRTTSGKPYKERAPGKQAEKAQRKAQRKLQPKQKLILLHLSLPEV